MEEDYSLKFGDMIPFTGMIKYGDRMYGKDTIDKRRMNGTIKNQIKIDARQILLFVYGVTSLMGVIAGLNAGLEKLLN